MTRNALKERWARGEVTLGAWLLTADTLAAETTASLHFDYIGIDVQHGAAGLDTAPDMITSIGHRTTPLVRIPENNAASVGRMLDAGALGVIVPLIESADQARAAVAACRYPPAGQRSFGPVRARAVYGSDYGAYANDLICCIPMIETVRGVANLDEILAVPGIDALYVGPADLSLSLGLPPLLDHDDREFTETLTSIAAAARRHGIVAGVHASAALADKRHDQGFTMITVGVDQAVLADGMRRALDTAHDATRVAEAQTHG